MAAASTSIEVFFRALGAATVKKAFADIGTASRVLRSATGSVFSAAGSGAMSLVKNLGGIVPVWNLATRAGKAFLSFLRTSVTTALSLGAAAYGVARAIGSISEATQDLQGTVLALRALNGEMDKAKGNPLFAADSKGGLKDINAGGSRRSADDLAYLNKLAFKTGQTINALAKDYLQLKAATDAGNISQDKMRRIFTAVNAQIVLLGRSQEDRQRAMRALAQIAGKGQVQAEELRGQLAEALPDAVPLAAKGLGVTVPELNKMMKAGTLTAEKFIDAYGRAIEKKYVPGLSKMVGTTRLALGQMKNAWEQAKVAVGSGQLDKTIGRLYSAVARLLNLLIKNGAFARFGAKLAATLERVVGPIEKLSTDGERAEKVLDAIAIAFDRLVVAAQIAWDMLGVAFNLFRQLSAVARGYGLSLQGAINALYRFAAGVLTAVNVFRTGVFSDSPVANFFAAVASAIVETVAALGRLAFGTSVVDGVSSGFQNAAYWIGQYAAAVRSVSTGKNDAALDANGEKIADGLRRAMDVARKLFDWLNQLRLAFVSLIMGEEAEGLDKRGKGMLGAMQGAIFVVQTLFGYLVALLVYLEENKEGVKSFFAGIGDAINGVMGAAEALGNVLRFFGINEGVGYLLGFMAVLSAILPIGTMLSVTFTAIAAAIGISGLALAGWMAAIAAIGLGVYLIWKYWDEIWTGIKGGFKILIAMLIEGIAWIVDQIPGLGKAAEQLRKYAKTEWRDSAEADAYALTQRQMQRQGDELRESGKLESAVANAQRPDMAAMTDAMKASYNAPDGAAGGAPLGNYGTPFEIHVYDGSTIKALADNGSRPTLERMAASEVRNRASVAPAWAGAQ